MGLVATNGLKDAGRHHAPDRRPEAAALQQQLKEKSGQQLRNVLRYPASSAAPAALYAFTLPAPGTRHWSSSTPGRRPGIAAAYVDDDISQAAVRHVAPASVADRPAIHYRPVPVETLGGHGGQMEASAIAG